MTKQQKINKYFNQKNKLTLKNRDYARQVKFLTDFFLAEDLFGRGDITTNLLIKKNKKTIAQIIVKESGVVAGIEEVKWLSKCYMIHVTCFMKDGQPIKKGDMLLTISGGIKDILKIERTILNILQRMSGIATQTAKLVEKTKNKILICPTRKTQWGLLDKKAVTLGGGGTHRLGLHDFVLIKDNHLAHTASFPRKGALPTRGFTPFPLSSFPSFWEIEADTPEQAFVFSAHEPDAIMFDNFSPAQIKNTINKLNPKIIFEASGGINENNIAEYAKTGVDVISLGALTHSTKALDIGLEIATLSSRA